MQEWLPIGAVAERTGVAASALRYYEREGLVTSERSDGGQRRYPREVLRRGAFIRTAQRVGLSLDEIRAAIAFSSRRGRDRLSRMGRALRLEVSTGRPVPTEQERTLLTAGEGCAGEASFGLLGSRWAFAR